MQSAYRSLILLSLIILPLISYNFMFAAWTSPATGTKSTTNAEAPVNVSNSAQVKLGALGTGALSVTGSAIISGNLTVSGSRANINQVRSSQYCDENGTNCFTAEAVKFMSNSFTQTGLMSNGSIQTRNWRGDTSAHTDVTITYVFPRRYVATPNITFSEASCAPIVNSSATGFSVTMYDTNLNKGCHQLPDSWMAVGRI